MRAILFTPKDLESESVGLAETAGYEVVKVYYVKGETNTKYYIGQDKLQELKSVGGYDAVIVFGELKSRHFINLQKELPGKKIVDKVFLLLEIFALHAGSTEAKMQIELARLSHELPILKDLYRRSKMGEQQGLLGAGAYGVEPQIKLYKRKIVRIKEELRKLKELNEKRSQERSSSVDFTVAIAGYANSGKSTLFNVLTNGHQKVDKSLFTTTSPKRKATVINGEKVVFIDTVGFIRGIPPEIVESFYVTLSEIKYSDLILMLFDASQDVGTLIDMLQSAIRTLRDIGVSGKPMILCLNKIDLDPNYRDKVKVVQEKANELYSPVLDVIPISALKGTNIELLRDKISRLISLRKSTSSGSITGRRGIKESQLTSF
ncbi:MAG: GTPase HflX [Thermoprotei archaeon]